MKSAARRQLGLAPEGAQDGGDRGDVFGKLLAPGGAEGHDLEPAAVERPAAGPVAVSARGIIGRQAQAGAGTGQGSYEPLPDTAGRQGGRA